MEDKIKTFSKVVHKNSLLNIILRCIAILFGLLQLKLNIFYLGSSVYGLWVTVASVSYWANFGDLGIGNGLRNELTKAIANNDYERQKCLIKTAFIMLSKITICIFIILSVVSEILIYSNVFNSELRMPLYITNGFFCISFILGLSRTIAYSYQQSWYASLAQTSTVIFQILGVVFLLFFSITPHLVIFAVFNGIAQVLGNLVICYHLYRYINRIIPADIIAKYNKSYTHSILSVGVQFFVLQICAMILYSTDNVIINKVFNSIEVAKYSVISQVFDVGGSFFSLLLISLWSAVTFVAENNNYSWIKTEINSLLKLFVVFSLGVIVVSVFFNSIIKVWLGNSAFYYEPELIVAFAVFAILNAFGSIYVNVANGLGKIKLQMRCGILGSIVNIPLSIFLAKTCGMGLSGIKIATTICCFGSMFLVPIQVNRLINKKNK